MARRTDSRLVAVIVRDGEVIARGRNLGKTDGASSSARRMKRSSSAEGPVAAVARLADQTAAEVRPTIMVRRLGSSGETGDAEQSSQQCM
jgi:hypothetical protein